MKKQDAIRLLGGTAASAARRIGISPSAISLWPEDLTDAISDRVQAAIARELLPPEQLGIGSEVQPVVDTRIREPGQATRGTPAADHPRRRSYEQPEASSDAPRLVDRREGERRESNRHDGERRKRQAVQAAGGET